MKTILVVDDENFNRQITINAIEGFEQEYSIISADNGLLGCELAEKIKPDLILMDWKMPNFSGYQALIRLKAQASTKHIPVVMCTGVTNEYELGEAIDVGASGTVAKPINKPELSTLLTQILSSNE